MYELVIKEEKNEEVETEPDGHHGTEAGGAAAGEAVDEGLQQIGEDAGEGDGDEDGLEELEDASDDFDGVDGHGADPEQGGASDGQPKRFSLEGAGVIALRRRGVGAAGFHGGQANREAIFAKW